MKGITRNSGIDILGEIPWGTHFCQFYQTSDDLIDILVPYFKEGLLNNEFCMWVTSEPLSVEKAKKSLEREIPDIDEYLEKGQIEIIPYDEWYVIEGDFDSDRVLDGWVSKLNQALKDGYEGLRLTGNTFWLEKEDWNDFVDYEEAVDNVIGKYQMVALCTYSLDKCTAAEIIDVINNHEFALIEREGKWDIIENSEHKQTKEEAIQSKKNWEQTFNAVPDLIAILDLDHKVVRVNKAMAAKLGLTPDECVGLPCYQAVHGTNKPPSFCPHSQLLKDGFEHTAEVHEDNLGGDFIVSASPLYDSAGKLMGSVHVARDMNERKKAEERIQDLLGETQQFARELEISNEELQNTAEELQTANEELRQSGEDLIKINLELEESEKRMNRSQEIAHIGSWELDIPNNHLYWSDEVYRIFGLQPQEFGATYEAFLEVIHPDDREAVDEAYSGSLSEGRDTYEIEHRVVRKSTGEIRNVYEKCEHKRDESGQIIRSVGMVHDITERKKTEEALKEAHDNLEQQVEKRTSEIKLANAYNRSLIESSVDPLVTIGPDGKITDVNKSTETVTGYSKDELLGTDFLDYFTEPEKAREGYQQVFMEGMVRDYPLEIQHKNGSVTPVLYNASVYRDEDDNVIGIFAAARDITERKRTEAEKQKLLEQAQTFAEDLEASNEELQNTTEELQSTNEELITTTEELQAANLDLKLASKYNRSLIEASVDPLVTIGPNGKITDVNESTEKVTGFNRNELIGTDFSDYFTQPEKAREGYRQVFKEGMVRDYPLGIQHKDGSVSPVLYNASVYRDEDDNVIGVFAAARDITELEKAEEEIQKLANLVESSEDAILTKSLEGNIITWNKGAEEIYGYTFEEVLGKNISFLSPSFIKEEINDLIERIKGGERVHHYETLRLKKDGSVINVSITLSPVFDTSGELVGISTIARDITARKKAEEELKLASKYNRSLIEASVDPLVTIGPDGKITDVNKSTEEVTGFKRQELIGTDFSDYFTDPDKASEGYEQVFREGFVRDYPLEIQHISGHVTTVRYNASVYRDESGKVIGVFAAARDITELRKIEEELRLSYFYNRSLIEASVDPLVTIGSDGKITDVNHSTEIVTGHSREELIDTDFSDYFTKPEKAREGYTRVFEEGMVLDYPLEIKHKNGHITPVLYNASVYKDESGKVIGVFAAARDITELKKAEEELRLSYIYNRSLIEASVDPLVTIGPDGKITDVNNSTEEVTGFNRNEIIGTDFSDYFTEPGKAREGYQLVFQEGKVQDYPLEIKHKNGVVTPVLYNASIYRNEDGKVIGVFAAARDITERKLAEAEKQKLLEQEQQLAEELKVSNKELQDTTEELQVSNEELENQRDELLTLNKALKENERLLELSNIYTRSLIEASIDPLVTIGPDGKITDVNDSTEAVTGLSREHLIGTDFSDYFTEPEKAREGYKKVFLEGEVIDYPLEIKHRNGGLTPVLYNASVYEDENGEVIGVFAAARDISELKKAEELLKLKLNELARSNAELEQFAYVSSHDLQEPLRMIGSYLQLLERKYGGQLDDKADKYINFAVDGANRMQNLIDDLLTFSRVTTQAKEFKLTDSQLILNGVLTNLSISIKENSATITHDNLPEIMADDTQMTQLLQNLIINALKFRSEDDPKIHISAREKDKYWIFSVKDNGIGIDPVYSERIFEVFKRLHKKRDYPGTGIGLSICKKIVERHGGNIWVDSKLEEGSTFYFTIPISNFNEEEYDET